MTTKFSLNAKHAGRPKVEDNACAFIRELPKDRDWVIRIDRRINERTDKQNHALFGVAYPVLSRETGFTKDELHEAFCKRFFGTVDRELFGQVVSKPYRTTTTGPDGRRDVIKTVDFSKFYEMVQQVGAEAGIDIPNPLPTMGDDHG